MHLIYYIFIFLSILDLSPKDFDPQLRTKEKSDEDYLTGDILKIKEGSITSN